MAHFRNGDNNSTTVIVQDTHCPYCNDEHAMILSERASVTTGLRLPQYGLKYILSLLYLSFLYMWLHGYKIIEKTVEFSSKTYGFCPKCGNSYAIHTPEEAKEVIEESKLYRIKTGKKVAGVCTGISEYTGIPLKWIRFLTLVYCFFVIGLIFYFLIAGFVPAKEAEPRFCRIKRRKVFPGVCRGIAAYLGVSVVWVRILTVLLSLLTVGGVAIIYILLGIFAPRQTEEDGHAET